MSRALRITGLVACFVLLCAGGSARGNVKALFAESQQLMAHKVDHLRHELKHLPTGRAAAAMLDGVVVEYYGAPVPISMVAIIAAPERGLLVVEPYDKSQIAAIERAIVKSDLGLKPTNDGKTIKLPVPAITDERRKEILKRADESAEVARTAIRQMHKDQIEKLKKMQKDGLINQDDERRGLDELQKLADEQIGHANEALLKKKAEIEAK